MEKKFYKTNYNKMLGGVCNGIAEYFNADVSLIRILFVVGTFASFSAVFWIYFALVIILPTKEY